MILLRLTQELKDKYLKSEEGPKLRAVVLRLYLLKFLLVLSTSPNALQVTCSRSILVRNTSSTPGPRPLRPLDHLGIETRYLYASPTTLPKKASNAFRTKVGHARDMFDGAVCCRCTFTLRNEWGPGAGNRVCVLEIIETLSRNEGTGQALPCGT